MTGALASAASRPVWFCDLDGTLVDLDPVMVASLDEVAAALEPEVHGDNS